MRRAALSALLLAAALVLQLTVVNRLPLPGGSAPDLVLLVVIALALCGGPGTGMIAGFCGGLSLDLAPPASQLIGQYALVFCVAGYGCGKLRGTLSRSALLPIVIAAGAALAGEMLSAGLGLALDPARVTWATVRHVLPFSVLCDVVISSPVLYLVMLVTKWADDHAGDGSAVPRPADSSGLLARTGAASIMAPGSRRRVRPGLPGGAGLLGGASWLARPRRSPAAGRTAGGRSPRPAGGRSPRPGGAATRLRGGWIGGRRPAWQAPAGQRRRATPRLRPGAGLAGSAARTQPARTQPARSRLSRSGLSRSGLSRSQPGRPVSLRLAAGRQADGKVSRPAPGALRSGATRRAVPRITFSGRSGRDGKGGWSGGSGHGTVLPGAGRLARGPARGPAFRPGAGSRGGSAANGGGRRPPAVRLMRPHLHLHGARHRDDVIGGGFLTGRKLGGRRRPAVAVRFGAGRQVRFGRPRPVRFRSGHGSMRSFWPPRRAGKRSSVRPIGGRRTGGSG